VAQAPRRLPEDAPNILIVMLDDAGFGQPSTFGGEIDTPTLSRLAEEGIAYNPSTPRPCARRPGPR
jgi:arylsulfatase A-like enzyme